MMRSILLCSLLIVSMINAGCKKEEAPPPPPAPKPAKPAAVVQKAVSTATAPLPAGNPYDVASKKDPFKPFIVAKPVVPAAAGVAPRGPLLPIQNYEVSQFRIIGIIAGLSENKAMVVDPAGKSYVLKEGMLIGPNSGRIVRIADSFIEVSEKYREDSGTARQRSVRLTLPRKQ